MTVPDPASTLPSEEAPPPAATTEVPLEYAGDSRLMTAADSSTLALFGNLRRDPVRFAGRVRRPLRFREALAALRDVVGSDYRYVPKDRAAYAAFRRMRQQTAGLSTWQAQQEYFSWLLRNDPLAFFILDPVVTVHPDQILFEVFSKDEGGAAQLAISRDAFEVAEEPVCGTTNIDFSETLKDSVLGIRSHRRTELVIAQEAVEIRAEGRPAALEKKVKIPDSWLRGFLQVQSAATLPRDRFELAPIDLYNALRQLRLHADQKRRRRGLRVELVPGEAPRLVLEPWETVISGTAGKYTGTQSRVVRVWGRRRLMLLRRLLPLTQKIEVQLLGSGMPSFWTLRAADFAFTLGLSGFTSADWSQSCSFDLLLPRKTQGSRELEKVVRHLSGRWKGTAAEIGASTKIAGAALLETLQLGCQQGQLMYDIASDLYRLRPLTDVPLDLPRLEFRNDREKQAHDLLARKGAVSLVSENRIAGTGVEVTGKVFVAEDQREYRPQLLLADDGRVLKAECTCPFHRKHGLKHGPAATLIALRLAYAKWELQRQTDAAAQRQITRETRTFSRRRPEGEDVVQIALERQRLKLKWGKAGQELRSQQFAYDTTEAAREVYLAKLAELQANGYLDASA